MSDSNNLSDVVAAAADKQRRLNDLLRHPKILRADKAPALSLFPTGFPALDRLLRGGWPAAALTEIFVERYGCGELSLLLPALVKQAENAGLLLWVAPPYIPYAPALKLAGIDLSRLLIVNAADDKDALWSMEQAIKSSACFVVLGWAATVNIHALRRLQLAAEQHSCWVVLFRPVRFVNAQSVAALRIRVAAHPESGLQLEVLKNRFASPGTLRVFI